MRRLQIISAFVNIVGGATLYRPGSDEGHSVGLRQRVTPPGEFETPDDEQAERLIAAKCLKDDGRGGFLAPEDRDPRPTPTAADVEAPMAVSHAFANPDAPSAIPLSEGHDPRVDGGPRHADGSAAGIAAIAPPAPAAPAPARNAGTGPADVAGADGGRGGDRPVSHRERRKQTREQSKT